MDPGAVRSVQAADLTMPKEELDEIWTPMHLERLARTYWRYLTRVTLGLIRVDYTDSERMVVLLLRPLVLLRFQAPEYEMDDDRGIVRWRSASGMLVARAGRAATATWRSRSSAAGRRPDNELAHVEVEVANFYPALATWIARWVYRNTQSRIHVIVTHGFLRSLARLDLEESAVGRYAPEHRRLARRVGTPARRPSTSATRPLAWAGIAAGTTAAGAFLYLRFWHPPPPAPLGASRSGSR